MESQELKKYNLPDEPGIYRFQKGRQILYIGKATSLRDRVRSYFNGDLGDARGPWLVKMLEEANNLSWEETASVLEALILESTLIKKYQPKYNAREKDDKSYNYVVITKEKWSRLLIVRGRDLERGSKYNLLNTPYQSYGPFPAGKDLKIALGLIRKIFPFRDNCLPYEVLPEKSRPAQVLPKSKTWAGKPCFNRQLGLCPGVCTGEISAPDYAKTISRLKLLLSGQMSRLRLNLEREMKTYAKKQEFEKAGEIKKQLFALDHIQDVALIKNNSRKNDTAAIRLEAYDVAHFSGANTVGAMTVWQNNGVVLSEYRRFQIKNNTKDEIDDLKNLAEILKRRLNHPEWPYPDVMIVDGDERARQVAENILREKDLTVSVVAVTKNKQHKAEKLLGDSAVIRDYHGPIVTLNAEAHRFAISYHRQKRSKNFLP